MLLWGSFACWFRIWSPFLNRSIGWNIIFNAFLYAFFYSFLYTFFKYVNRCELMLLWGSFACWFRIWRPFLNRSIGWNIIFNAFLYTFFYSFCNNTGNFPYRGKGRISAVNNKKKTVNKGYIGAFWCADSEYVFLFDEALTVGWLWPIEVSALWY